jgi:hypothetical protein
MSPRGERRLYRPICEHFSHYGDYYEEVPLGKKRIDLVFCSRNGYLTSVEVKTEKWRAALSQALVNQLVSDYSYVALPTEVCERVDESLFADNGVGLLSVGRTARTEICAIRAAYKDREMFKQVKDYLEVTPR